jgi:hypothetical protein
LTFSCHRTRRPTAYLEFRPQRKSAAEVASLLERNKVLCVALNSCESAVVDKGKDANLARIFTGKGIGNVLAMSFRVSPAAARTFYMRFYERFFLHQDSFATAAGYGRTALFERGERRNNMGQDVQLRDDYVPVTYSTGTDVKIILPIQLTPDPPDPHSIVSTLFPILGAHLFIAWIVELWFQLMKYFCHPPVLGYPRAASAASPEFAFAGISL